MQTREFGSTGRRVAVIGQGTWYGAGDKRRAAVAALRKGIDLGMTHIDTAEMYLNGEAEEWVAEAVGPNRDKVFLVSKVLPGNASRQGTIAACERSLRRLKTDRLDCYLLHWPGEHRLDDTIAAFEQLEAERKILSWGVSNFDAPELKGRRPVCNQVLYHLEERAVEHAVIPWCEQNRAALVAYSPFGHGDFPDNRVLAQIADELSATPHQVALRFLLRWPGAFAIPKTNDLDHVAENAAAGDLELTAAQISRLEQAFPLGLRPRYLPML